VSRRFRLSDDPRLHIRRDSEWYREIREREHYRRGLLAAGCSEWEANSIVNSGYILPKAA